MKQGWEIKKLGEVCDILDSQRKPVTKKDRKEGQYPYYGATGIQDYVDSYIFDGRYLLLGEDGAKWGPMDKSAFIVEGKCWVNNHAHILKVHDCLIDTFAEYYLVFKDLDEYITGAIVRKLTQQALRNIPIPVPPIAEQEKIVAELDCLSGIIEKKKQQLKELDNLAQSIFYEMFGDPVENDKGWNVQGFSTACDVITDFVAAGSFADIKKNVQYKESQDYAQLVRTTDLKNKFMKSGFVYISESAFNYLWRVNLNQECIILPNVGVNCGEVYYVNPSMLPYSNNVLGPNAILVRSKKENHRYLSALFTTSYFQCQLKGIVNAVGQPKFNKTELKKLEVILPPLPLQQEFASKIESIEKQKELIAQSIKEAETLFNSRMDYYFG